MKALEKAKLQESKYSEELHRLQSTFHARTN